MLEDKRSHGLWELSAPPAPPTTVLREQISADVVIVGGGYTGLSAALHLARGGKKVVVLEAIEIGFGASGRNSGFVNAGLWVMPDDLIATLGQTYGNRLIGLLGEAPREVFALTERYGMECQADHRGTYHCAVGASGLKQLQARQAQWSKLGAKVELLSAGDTQARTGTTGYTGSLFDPRAGTIQPLAYARGLAGAAMTEGATIHTGSAVTGLERNGSAWLVRTASGSVSANWLILATDAYSTGVTTSIREEQVHLPYFHVSTAPLGHNIRKTILPHGGAGWDTKTILSGFRLDAEGRLIVGSVGALRGTGLSVHRAWAKRHIRKLFPQLGEFELETEWYGKIGMTPDHLPRLHSYGPNALGFSGYNGRGIAPGTVFGRELARLILGEIDLASMPLPVSEIAIPAFRGLREAYYEVGAQVAHLPIAPA
ncbi:NAD(P)/FAD-dependent oxidoreductase [Bosea sp. 2KB_26]|uniref:NAD(P)/FAD-dependent oxidoreductase n=1 Tax=Bosea sp. 2KB_26 TaxID=3237475 RepID=UPI003F904563